MLDVQQDSLICQLSSCNVFIIEQKLFPIAFFIHQWMKMDIVRVGVYMGVGVYSRKTKT